MYCNTKTEDTDHKCYLIQSQNISTNPVTPSGEATRMPIIQVLQELDYTCHPHLRQLTLSQLCKIFDSRITQEISYSVHTFTKYLCTWELWKVLHLLLHAIKHVHCVSHVPWNTVFIMVIKHLYHTLLSVWFWVSSHKCLASVYQNLAVYGYYIGQNVHISIHESYESCQHHLLDMWQAHHSSQQFIHLVLVCGWKAISVVFLICHLLHMLHQTTLVATTWHTAQYHAPVRNIENSKHSTDPYLPYESTVFAFIFLEQQTRKGNSYLMYNTNPI